MRIYVGALSAKTSEQRLREHFETFGEVEEVVLIMNRARGKSRGYAFVTMNNEENAKSAIEATHGAELDGATLKVNEAQPRPAGSGARGGGRAGSELRDGGFRGGDRDRQESW